VESISCASDISVNKASGNPWAATEGVINMQRGRSRKSELSIGAREPSDSLRAPYIVIVVALHHL
jgi:hypothetical protein